MSNKKRKWVVQNNIIGSAYVNRFYKIEDFKPGRLLKQSQIKSTIYMAEADFKLPPLKLEFEIIDGYIDVNDYKQQNNLAGFASVILITFEDQKLEYNIKDFGIKMRVSEDVKDILRQKKAERDK